MMFGGSFVLMFVQCLALAIIAERLGIRGAGWMSGVKLGCGYRWLFCRRRCWRELPVREKPLSLFINGGYAVMGNIIAGIIICSWE